MARVFAIEDDFLVAAALRLHIEEMGHELAGLAATYDEALSLAEGAAFDIILSDIRIGVPDGIDAVEAILKIRCVPVIFITGYGGQNYLERIAKIRPFSVILKPFGFDELERAIASALEGGPATRPG
ncbi:MAG TPA: response regulator [Alphaproteobacteria bacterium]|nr:response regulator [Alphaproteobacteria bacterium]